MYDLIIIGLGPAGINACIYAKRSNLNVIVIEKALPGGMLHNIKDVENYLGYEHINGSDLAMQFYHQFKDLDIPMIKSEVISVLLDDDVKIVKTTSKEYKAKAIIIATGRGSLKLGLENENISGVSTCALCDGSLYKDKVACVYGNIPKVLDDSNYLVNIVKKLYIVTSGNKLIGDNNLINSLENNEKVEIIYNENIMKINGQEKLESINLREKEINLDGLFIDNGYGPVTYFIKNLNITDEKGYIIVNEKQETSIKGIFACGDSTKKDIYQIITAASEGASAAINAYKYIKS